MLPPNVITDFTAKMETGKELGSTHAFFLLMDHAPGYFPGNHNARPRLCCHEAHILIRRQIDTGLVELSAVRKRKTEYEDSEGCYFK